jgi:hypothetical protein
MFTLEGPHIVMSRTDVQKGLDFHFNLIDIDWQKILANFIDFCRYVLICTDQMLSILPIYILNSRCVQAKL